jgi:4-hydroxy-3-polyprenylbenzoate decarboxylase
VAAITGASGAAYGVRVVECAARAGLCVTVIVTAAGRMVLAEEAGAPAAAQLDDLVALWPAPLRRRITVLPAENVAAPPASGSFGAAATVICPCSMNTLAAVSHGLAGNLVQRAAAVALKEGRPLVLVPREMPMTAIDFENMARLARAGAAVIPACPAFYHRPQTVADLVDSVAAKVLERLGIPHDLKVRWPGCDQA